MNGKQTRQETSRTPEGCVGTPSLEQACNAPNPNINLSIEGIHNPAAMFSGEVYIDNVKPATAEQATLSSVAGVAEVPSYAFNGKHITISSVAPGVHTLKITGSDLYDRILKIEVKPGAENTFPTIDVLDKVPGVVDYLARLNGIARTIGKYDGDGLKCQNGTARPIQKPVVYVDVSKMVGRDPNWDQRPDTQIADIKTAALTHAPFVYSTSKNGRLFDGIPIVYVCTGENPTKEKCSTNILPDYISTNNAFVVTFDPQLSKDGIGAVYFLTVRNGILHNGTIVDNVITGGKLVLSPRAGHSAINQDLLQLFGVRQDAQVGTYTKEDSIFNDFDWSSTPTRLDQIVGNSVSNMQTCSVSPYDTSAFEVLSPTSVSAVSYSNASSDQELGFGAPSPSGYAPPVLGPSRPQSPPIMRGPGIPRPRDSRGRVGQDNPIR